MSNFEQFLQPAISIGPSSPVVDIPRYNKEAGNKVDKNNNRPNHCNPIRLGICCSFLLTYGFRPQSPILSYGFH